MPKTMKIQVSKTMVKFLNEKAENMQFHYRIEPAHFFSCQYDYVDCDHIKIIIVTYPPEYYAIPGAITTAELLDCYTKSNGTADSFRNRVYEMMEI